MILDTSHRDRISPRQAIVAIHEPITSEWASTLTIPLLLDVIGSLVAVNGASLAIGCSGFEQAQPLAEVLPAGVDLIVPPANERRSTGIWFVRQFAARGFERVVLVAADTVGLSSRILTTALSVLANEPHVCGQAPSGGSYLAGLRGGSRRFEDGDTADLIGSLSNASAVEIAGSRVERRHRLRDLTSLDAFMAASAGHERLLRRTLGYLEAGMTDAAWQQAVS